MDLFRNIKELQFGTSKLYIAKAIDKSNKGEERYVIEKRRRLGGVVLHLSPLEKSKSSGR